MPPVPPTHSSESDGFTTTSAGFHAVFHIFDDCGYLRRVTQDGYGVRGIGQDNMGYARVLCRNCERLLFRSLGVSI